MANSAPLHSLRQGIVSSVTQSCRTLWDPIECNTPGSLSITNFRSLLKRMSTASLMPSKHVILCPSLHLLPSIFPSNRVFSNELVPWINGQSIGVSASASVLPVNIQDWFPSGWTGWSSLQSKGLSRVFSNTTVLKHQFCGTQLSLYSNSHIHTWLLEKP